MSWRHTGRDRDPVVMSRNRREAEVRPPYRGRRLLPVKVVVGALRAGRDVDQVGVRSDDRSRSLRVVLPVLIVAILFTMMTVFIRSHGSTVAAVLVAADGMLVTGYIAVRVWAKARPRVTRPT